MKGILFPIGGHLELVPYNPIIKEMESLLDSRTLVIIPAASATPLKTARNYSFIFNTFGINTKIIHLKSRSDADQKKNVEYIQNAGGIFFTGGNQLRLTSLLGGTEVHKIITKKLADDRDFLVSGTSAGAVSISDTMVAYGEAEEALLKGAIRLSPGLGFIDNMIIDTHFITRNRIWRLLQVVAENPGLLGIGLAENTGLIIDSNRNGKIVGEGTVVVVDGSEVTYTNIPDIEDGEPFSINGIKVDILTDGKTCNLAIP